MPDQDTVQPTTPNEEIQEVIILENQINSAEYLPTELREKSLAMINRLKRVAKYGHFSAEYEPIAKYVEWITSIPWGEVTEDNLNLENAKEELDKTHYGLLDVKERILEYIAMLHLRMQNEQDENNNEVITQVPTPPGDVSAQKINSEEMARLQGSSSHAPVVCLVGVQGIGKTSIAKSIAKAINRKFVRVALGGVGNVTEIRGVSRSQVDAEPGQIIKSLVRTGVMNPLILIDEIDKVSDYGGVRDDMMAALLEILDPEQNSTFKDHYLDYPVDLSHVMFICTANNLGGISAALLDRLEVIRMSSYTDEEKAIIAKNYLLKKVMESSGMKPEQLKFSDDVWPYLIRPLGFDAGIRQLERNITTLVRKVAKKIVEGKGTSFEITPANFREYIPEDFGVYS